MWENGQNDKIMGKNEMADLIIIMYQNKNPNRIIE